MFGEDFEERAQESVSTEHSCGSNLDRSDSGFVRDGFDCLRRSLRLTYYQSAAAFLRARIADTHGNVSFNCRMECLWMQYLGAEVSQFGSFFKRQMGNCAC